MEFHVPPHLNVCKFHANSIFCLPCASKVPDAALETFTCVKYWEKMLGAHYMESRAWMQSVALTLDAEGCTDLPEGGSHSKYLACFMQGLFTEPCLENSWYFALTWSPGTLIKAWDQVLLPLQFPISRYWASPASFCGQSWGPKCGERMIPFGFPHVSSAHMVVGTSFFAGQNSSF